jgi:hypothetical protein
VTLQAFQPQPTYINLGSGTTFGNGYTDRNVNLGTVPVYSQPVQYGYPTGGYYQPQPTSVPNPEFKKNPYGLGDDQMIEGGKVVGKDRGIGIIGGLQGLGDAIAGAVGIETDFDKRGYGWGRGGTAHSKSGYGGRPTLGSVPQTITNPNLPTPQMPTFQPNLPNQGALPGGPMGMPGYYGQQAAIGTAGHVMSRAFNNQVLDDLYARSLQARRDSDAQDVLTSIQLQNTPLGQQKIASKRQAQMTEGAQANYLRRLGVAALSNAAANKIKGIESRVGSGAHSSAHVGNWGVQRMA